MHMDQSTLRSGVERCPLTSARLAGRSSGASLSREAWRARPSRELALRTKARTRTSACRRSPLWALRAGSSSSAHKGAARRVGRVIAVAGRRSGPCQAGAPRCLWWSLPRMRTVASVAGPSLRRRRLHELGDVSPAVCNRDSPYGIGCPAPWPSSQPIAAMLRQPGSGNLHFCPSNPRWAGIAPRLGGLWTSFSLTRWTAGVAPPPYL